MTFIQLPYVIVSRFDYDWLVFSRNSLTFIVVILTIALYDAHRPRALLNTPKDEPATPEVAEE
jgi:hypothetical protein